jgi:hypothetical protein
MKDRSHPTDLFQSTGPYAVGHTRKLGTGTSWRPRLPSLLVHPVVPVARVPVDVRIRRVVSLGRAVMDGNRTRPGRLNSAANGFEDRGADVHQRPLTSVHVESPPGSSADVRKAVASVRELGCLLAVRTSG